MKTDLKKRGITLAALAAFTMLGTRGPMQDPQQKPETAPATAAAAPAPKVGAPMPPFRLNDHEGRAVALGGKSDHWTVVAFYPKAATPG